MSKGRPIAANDRTFKIVLEITMSPNGALTTPVHNDVIEALHGALVTASNNPGEIGDGLDLPAYIDSWTINKPRAVREAYDCESNLGSPSGVNAEVAARALTAYNERFTTP